MPMFSNVKSPVLRWRPVLRENKGLALDSLLPRPQGLLLHVFQNGGLSGEDPGKRLVQNLVFNTSHFEKTKTKWQPNLRLLQLLFLWQPI